jgi:hypothetical protein
MKDMLMAAALVGFALLEPLTMAIGMVNFSFLDAPSVGTGFFALGIYSHLSRRELMRRLHYDCRRCGYTLHGVRHVGETFQQVAELTALREKAEELRMLKGELRRWQAIATDNLTGRATPPRELIRTIDNMIAGCAPKPKERDGSGA